MAAFGVNFKFTEYPYCQRQKFSPESLVCGIFIVSGDNARYLHGIAELLVLHFQQITQLETVLSLANAACHSNKLGILSIIRR